MDNGLINGTQLNFIFRVRHYVMIIIFYDRRCRVLSCLTKVSGTNFQEGKFKNLLYLPTRFFYINKLNIKVITRFHRVRDFVEI